MGVSTSDLPTDVGEEVPVVTGASLGECTCRPSVSINFGPREGLGLVSVQIGKVTSPKLQRQVKKQKKRTNCLSLGKGVAMNQLE